ncbi:MAG: J domain-containing protein [Desulfobacteraceae bacterium]|nr:J domain-containing protein [Desulfobacteraceae bacterium]MCF8094629.1 J domain-containing protein [Desulfobacteraceae bacterium]
MNPHYYETLTEITVDNYSFKVTWDAASRECCILWIQDTDTMDQFEALGRFSRFDRRNILEFVVRYVSSHELREEISKRRFSLYIEKLSPRFFKEIQRLDYKEKAAAFRNLFNLDSEIDEAADLGWKRRLMAKKFHPDKGGDNRAMELINEGYELLKSKNGKSFNTDGENQHS